MLMRRRDEVRAADVAERRHRGPYASEGVRGVRGRGDEEPVPHARNADPERRLQRAHHRAHRLGLTVPWGCTIVRCKATNADTTTVIQTITSTRRHRSHPARECPKVLGSTHRRTL
jgi:hypothetical protein